MKVIPPVGGLPVHQELVAASAAIVHYGPPAPTVAQVAAVRQWASQVVVIANDGTADCWYESDPNVRWVVPDRNLGYGGAGNAALAESDQPIVVILNTDISIPAAAARGACRAVQERRAGIVGLRMSNANGDFLSGAGSLSRFLLLGRMQKPTDSLELCQWVSGAAMFVSRECLEQVRFDERFFLGIEDVDFCLRAHEHGYRTAVLGAPEAVHEGGKVIGSARWYYYSARNPIWFLRSRRRWPFVVALEAREVILLARVVVADLLKRRGWERSRLMALGIWHGVALHPRSGAPPFEWEPVEVERGLNA